MSWSENRESSILGNLDSFDKAFMNLSMLACSGVGRFRSGTANKSCACAEVIYRARAGRRGFATWHAGCALVCFPDLYTGGCTPGDVSESEAESGCVLHAL